MAAAQERRHPTRRELFLAGGEAAHFGRVEFGQRPGIAIAGESMIASAMAIYNEILASYPEYLDALYTGFHYDVRGEGVTGSSNEENGAMRCRTSSSTSVNVVRSAS